MVADESPTFSSAFGDMHERAMKVMTADEIVARFATQVSEGFAKAEEMGAPPPDVLWSIEAVPWGENVTEMYFKHDGNEMNAERELWILGQRQFRLLHDHNEHAE